MKLISRSFSLVSNVITLLAVLGVFLYFRNPSAFNFFAKLLQSQMTTEPRVVSVQQIQQVGQLATAIGTYETIVPVENSNSLAGVEIGRTSLIYIAHVRVRAGFDLSQITNANITQELGKFIVQLPAPQILSVEPDWEKSKVFDYERSNFLAPDSSVEMIEAAEDSALQQIRASVCQGDLLDQAANQAQQIIPLTISHFGIAVEVRSQPWTVDSCQTNFTR